MLRWLTAGESHGPALVGIIEGVPAGVELTAAEVQDALARRRLGYGRGARMKFEQDEVTMLGGVRHGLTQGGPVAIAVANTEWPKWETVMSADPVDPAGAGRPGPQRPADPPRPGHADFTGMQKYGFDEARPVLERASARETAARVALGTVAAKFLAALGVRLVSHTVADRPRSRVPEAAASGRRTTWPRWTRTRCAALTPHTSRGHGRRSRRTPTRKAKPSAASSRCSPTGCRRDWAATCTGTAGWTHGWPPR